MNVGDKFRESHEGEITSVWRKADIMTLRSEIGSTGDHSTNQFFHHWSVTLTSGHWHLSVTRMVSKYYRLPPPLLPEQNERLFQDFHTLVELLTIFCARLCSVCSDMRCSLSFGAWRLYNPFYRWFTNFSFSRYFVVKLFHLHLSHVFFVALIFISSNLFHTRGTCISRYKNSIRHCFALIRLVEFNGPRRGRWSLHVNTRVATCRCRNIPGSEWLPSFSSWSLTGINR